MFLGSYTFEGEPSALIDAYDKLMASFPPDSLLFHACVVRDDGITVFDSCPSREVFSQFSADPSVRNAFTAAGLPEPAVTMHGDVHAAVVAAKSVL